MSEVLASQLPVWLIFGIVGVQAGVKLNDWRKNGHSLDVQDRPRAHTDLLKDLVAGQNDAVIEQKEQTLQLRKIVSAIESKVR